MVFYDFLWLKNSYYYKRRNCEWIVNDAALHLCMIYLLCKVAAFLQVNVLLGCGMGCEEGVNCHRALCCKYRMAQKAFNHNILSHQRESSRLTTPNASISRLHAFLRNEYTGSRFQSFVN